MDRYLVISSDGHAGLPPEQYRDYRNKWDPAAHLPHAKMPMLFVTSVADPVFQIDIFANFLPHSRQVFTFPNHLEVVDVH